MSPPGTLRWLGPAALGSALASGLLLHGDTPKVLREWHEGEAEALPEVARAAVAARQAPLPHLARLQVLPVPAKPQASRASRASRASSASSAGQTSTKPPLANRARTRLAQSASDIVLAGALADVALAFVPPTPLLPAEALAPTPPPSLSLPPVTTPASVTPAPPALAVPQGWSLPDEVSAGADQTTQTALISPQPRAPITAAPAFVAAAATPNSPVPLPQPSQPIAPIPAAPAIAAETRPLVAIPTPPAPAVASTVAPTAVQTAVQTAIPSPTAARPATPPSPPLALAVATAPVSPPALARPAPALAAPAAAALASQGVDFSPGRQTFPAAADAQLFTYDDELILQLRVAGLSVSDTIVAYGTRAGVYLPLGEMAQILDLAIRVSDDGNYASGWFLEENRTLVIDLRQGLLTTAEGTTALPPDMAQAFDGELYLRSDAVAMLLPLDVAPDLRAQSVLLTTREPFPFEERMRREESRDRLGLRAAGEEDQRFPREETPWLAASVPMADVELRGVSDSARGTRAEADVRLAGDLAFMTAQAFFSVNSRDGLVASLVELGRRDADGDLLGPLGATEFQLGDVTTPSMPLGLRGATGRGAFITNQPLEQVSVFDRIDLRGVLPDGYEVELYRNDILLGSTADVVNGQYEFLEIPVDYGLNIFRLIFYGPQGQRREEVRRISVGDGRLAAGEFHYNFGAVQRGVNLLGVEGPDFRPGLRFGSWQASGELAYGISPAITAVAGAALYEEAGAQRWIASSGLRTGLGGLALRGDAGISQGGGRALGAGLGGRALGGAFAITHFEYGGGFLDEVQSSDSAALRRSSEADFNTTLLLGSELDGTFLPLTARLRHAEFADGRTRTSAGLRGSARLAGLMVSNTVDFLRNTATGGIGFSQLVGNFDLATFNRSDTQLRGSLGYRILPDPGITQVAASVGHRFDDVTLVSASAAYALDSKDLSIGLSGGRQFDRFTLSLDGQYSFRQQSYSVGLRLAFSLGRDPLRQRFFIDQPGLAASGSVALQVFHDRDGSGTYTDGDLVLPEVDFAVFNSTATTDARGMARLGDLGHGNRVIVQLDPASLPDIAMAPATRGIEIVPRPGRFHISSFPVVELSEVEGTVSFAGSEASRGVSGLRLQLQDPRGDIAHSVRTERGGYFFFEQVRPGTYTVLIEPEQAVRLGICLVDLPTITVSAQGGVLARDLAVTSCTPPAVTS